MKNFVSVLGITSIVFLETIALLKGVNGKVFALSIGAIFGIVGYFWGKKRAVNEYIKKYSGSDKK